MIKTNEDLLKRVEAVLSQIEDDERYPESADTLINIMAVEFGGALDGDPFADEEIDLSEKEYDPEFLKDECDPEMLMGIAEGLHDTDGAQPMHPAVAKLVIEIYEDAIERDNADAMCNLGSLFYTGRAGEQNYEKAAKYYTMADERGERQATENLGYIYYYGRTGAKDYEKAFQYFIKGALDGHLRSLYKIGDFYKNGYYVKKDVKEAFIIYKHCLDTMTEEALPQVGADVFMRVADCYFLGMGTEKDLLAAQHYFAIAEQLFYKRLIEGDFYQKRNLEHVLEMEEKVRREIKEKMIPDLSWAKYND